jgi:hypothetical protein
MRISFWIVTLFVSVLSCSATSASSTLIQSKPRADTSVIDSLPAPNDKEIREIRTAKQWHNPVVIVHRDGYELILSGQPRDMVHLSLGTLEETLLKLPRDRWPLGRVVAVEESSFRSPGDDPKIALHVKALKRMLGSYKLRADLWPSG